MNIKQLGDIIEANGFHFEHHKDRESYYALLEQSTPLGEDWCMEFYYTTMSDLVEQIILYAEEYDAEEEAKIWIERCGENGIPNSIRDLLDDADWKGNILSNLVEEFEEEWIK